MSHRLELSHLNWYHALLFCVHCIITLQKYLYHEQIFNLGMSVSCLWCTSPVCFRSILFTEQADSFINTLSPHLTNLCEEFNRQWAEIWSSLRRIHFADRYSNLSEYEQKIYWQNLYNNMYVIYLFLFVMTVFSCANAWKTSWREVLSVDRQRGPCVEAEARGTSTVHMMFCSLKIYALQ